jgi:uncharacterized protein (DUF433 family)
VAELLGLFDYEYGIVLRWHIAGRESAVYLDPRVNFGQPTAQGIKTWVLAGRRRGGETIPSIMADFVVKEKSVLDALAFERVPVTP